MRKIEIPSSPWPDHDPIVFIFVFLGLTRPTYQWRLNDSLLVSQDAFSELHSCLQNFFSENVGSVLLVIYLWEAQKATMMGHCIELPSSRKRVSEKRSLELTNLLASADMAWKSHLTQDFHAKRARDAAVVELDLLLCK